MEELYHLLFAGPLIAHLNAFGGNSAATAIFGATTPTQELNPGSFLETD